MDILKEFKHKLVEHVRYNDIDTFGHVNNARYLVYLEEARIAYFEAAVDFDKQSLAFGSVVAHVDIDYLSPIGYGDVVEVYTRCVRIGTKSSDYENVIIKRPCKNLEREVVSAKARVTLVAFDPETERSVANNPVFVERIRAFENVDL